MLTTERPPHCFTCGDEPQYDDAYLSQGADGVLKALPVCEPCRLRHGSVDHVDSGYLIGDRLAHGLPATGGAIPA